MSTPGPFSLEGKVAIVTGASRNIGAAISRLFAESGAELLVVARDPERLERFAAELEADTGRRVVPLALDVADPAAPARIVERCVEEFGRVDILVNNAYSTGSDTASSIFEVDPEVWAEPIAVNVMAPFRLAQLAAARMREQPEGGNIVNVVSGSGILPVRGNGPYGATKAALWMLTRTLADEGAPLIRANALCPGITSEDGEPFNDAQRRLLPLVPMGRLGRPEEIAAAALYLASPAASYTTGALLVVNGGRPW